MARPDNAASLPVATGSYLQSAENARMEGDSLAANLRREDGTWIGARVRLQPPALANIDGVFVYVETQPAISARVGGAQPPASPASSLSSTAKAVAAIGGQLTGTTETEGAQ